MYYLFFSAAWSILIPAIFALIRFAHIPRVFKPLVYLLWLGAVSEISATIAAQLIRNNLFIYNLYMLADFFMTLWLFKRWGTFQRTPQSVQSLFALFFVVLWIFDNLLLNRIDQENIIFRILYSITLVLLGIDQLSRIFINNNNYLRRNPYFYVSLAIIFNYSYSAFIAVLNNSPLFGPGIELWKYTMLIYVIVNVTTYMLYTISLLWMHQKVEST
jgi:hypothetical protein